MAATTVSTLCFEGKTAAVQAFLTTKPDAVCKPDGDGRTPLHWVRGSGGFRFRALLLSLFFRF
jgi:hypothetical protein